MKINNGAPIAEPISEAEDFTPNPEGPELPPGIGGPIPGLPFDPQNIGLPALCVLLALNKAAIKYIINL